MERVCFLARVRPECLAQYQARHQEVWPEMLAALRDAGWGNYSLFLADDGLLIGYVETGDYQAALDAMAATDVNKRWQAAMAGFFVADGPPDQTGGGFRGDTPFVPPGWHSQRIAEIFHLDSQEMTPNA